MSTVSEPVGIEKAISLAITFFRSMYPGKKVVDILLEEVRESDDETCWLITVGYSRPDSAGQLPHLEQIIGKSWKREYKVITIEKATGKVKSMTLREGLEIDG